MAFFQLHRLFRFADALHRRALGGRERPLRRLTLYAAVRRAEHALLFQRDYSLFGEGVHRAAAELVAKLGIAEAGIFLQKRECRRLRLGARGDFGIFILQESDRFEELAHGALAHFGGQKQPQNESLRAMVARGDALDEGEALRGERLVHHRKDGFQLGGVEIAPLLEPHDVARTRQPALTPSAARYSYILSTSLWAMSTITSAVITEPHKICFELTKQIFVILRQTPLPSLCSGQSEFSSPCDILRAHILQ